MLQTGTAVDAAAAIHAATHTATNKKLLMQVRYTATTVTATVALSPPLDNVRVMVIVWRLRGNIIRTALCWIVWHNVYRNERIVR